MCKELENIRDSQVHRVLRQLWQGALKRNEFFLAAIDGSEWYKYIIEPYK